MFGVYICFEKDLYTVSGFQAVVQTLREDEANTTAISDISISRDVARLSEVADISEGPEDDDNGKHSTALALLTYSLLMITI